MKSVFTNLVFFETKDKLQSQKNIIMKLAKIIRKTNFRVIFVCVRKFNKNCRIIVEYVSITQDFMRLESVTLCQKTKKIELDMNFGLKQVCKLELESSYYERCTRSSKGRVWSLSSRTIGRMFESCSLQTTMTDTQLFQGTTIHAILPQKASQSEVPVGAGP